LQGLVSPNKLYWVGALVPGYDPIIAVNEDNYVKLRETFDDKVSDPTVLSEVVGSGVPVPTAGEDGFRLEVDLSTCTYQFFVITSQHTKVEVTTTAVLTVPGPDEGLRTYNLDLPLGLLQKGITPLGSWRTDGLGEDYSTIPDRYAPDASFPTLSSYSVGVIIPPNLDGYIPSGLYNQGLFFDLDNPVPRPKTVYMLYGIVPQP
jgi:hypothetical protein